jgi:thiol-disulfide isomerase/thioredoxin
MALADELPPFPADPAQWINSGPLTTSGLKGKGIVLWFFDDQCPRCRSLWPALLEMSKKFENQPVVFIAVNSGAGRAELEEYARSVKCTWPFLVDTSREFEKACGISPISLRNIYQLKYAKADGSFQYGDPDDMPGTAEKALEGAQWKVPPTDIPEALKPTWIAIETGNYKAVAAPLKKAQNASKAETKEAARKLMEIVQQEIDDQISAIKQAQESGNNWTAFQLCNQFSGRFTGFELPKDVATLKKDLLKDAKVKAGLAAQKSMESARKSLSSGNPTAQKKALATLEQIISDFPDTDLSQSAQAMIDSTQTRADK